ncbi:MAG TPA: PhoH family protein [Methanosarcina sp.]|nr:PhoH family protein [Methanosarcina sp.]
MTKRATKRREADVLKLVATNQAAINEGPRKKTFSVHDMHPIEPLTDNQEAAFELFDIQPDCGIFLEGCPGTGKTFIALYNGLKLVLDKNTPYKKLVIIRSTVPTRDMGFLKGTEEEKIAAYERPYHSLFDHIFKYKKSYDNMKEAGLIEFESTAFLRGTTFDDCIVILDEAQNVSFNEGMTVASRIGTNSKFIMCGDTHQSDFKKDTDKSETEKFFKLIRSMPSVDSIKFHVDDIVRSGWCRELIETQIKLGFY